MSVYTDTESTSLIVAGDLIAVEAGYSAGTHASFGESMFEGASEAVSAGVSSGTVEVFRPLSFPSAGTEYCRLDSGGGVSYVSCDQGGGLRVDSSDGGDSGNAVAEFGDVEVVEVLRRAVDSVSVDGAGLVVQPQDWVYTNIPTLAHAKRDRVSVSAHVLGVEVPVVFTAQVFEFDFHTPGGVVRSLSRGKPYPNMDIQATYYEENPAQTVTLRTTWAAQAWDPVSGRSVKIDGALVTVEESMPFEVRKRRVRLSR